MNTPNIPANNCILKEKSWRNAKPFHIGTTPEDMELIRGNELTRQAILRDALTSALRSKIQRKKHKMDRVLWKLHLGRRGNRTGLSL